MTVYQPVRYGYSTLKFIGLRSMTDVVTDYAKSAPTPAIAVRDRRYDLQSEIT